MKKKLMGLLIAAAVVVCAAFAWRIAYSLRKSNDNLPALTAIAEMSEAEVNSILPGYKVAQLKEVWGKPDTSEENTACWETGDVTLIVNYKSSGVIVVCGLKDGSGRSVGEE